MAMCLSCLRGDFGDFGYCGGVVGGGVARYVTGEEDVVGLFG